MLNSTTIDYRLVREWIEECQQSHEKCNNVTMLKRFDFMIPEQSMFIDVRRERIVDVITNCEYATLSHVWGECQLSLTTRSQLSQLKEIGSLSVRSLPPTIRDAMTLTRAIGIRYLWVDALCILQDDKEHKAKQIAQMHNIYAAATMTIVAAAANDANSGLPGVGSSARDLNQYITTLAGLRLAARQGFLNVSLNRSTYNKRAWTYQESSISHRLLYITSKGAFMQCCQ
ncbi:HET-domain-containing protein, partial [Viridothelium virens]